MRAGPEDGGSWEQHRRLDKNIHSTQEVRQYIYSTQEVRQYIYFTQEARQHIYSTQEVRLQNTFILRRLDMKIH